MRHDLTFATLILAVLSAASQAQEPFSRLVGPVTVAPVKPGAAWEVPFITWGGDVPTFHANGGLQTKSGSLFQQHGLNLKLVAGDDFVGQVKNYLSGKSPFLRGTTGMLGMASEVIGADPRTKPVVFLQLTWSKGDHMVGREAVKDLNQLKGKKVVLQRGGPHVGLLDEILTTAKLTWKDITPVWVDELTGDKGPAAAFKKDSSIDCCMVISPDMIGLTGGLDGVGTGAEGTVKGAHVVISTDSMNRAVADVYACRKDFYDKNKVQIEKFVAGYLKACEEVAAMRKEFLDKKTSPRYMAVLKLAQDIYGKQVLPTLEVDADGLVADAEFVFLPGNKLFFEIAGNRVGFAEKEKGALDLAVNQGYAKNRSAFFAPKLDYDKIASLGKLTNTELDLSRFTGAEVTKESFVSPESISSSDSSTIYSFSIHFEPDTSEFKAEVYGPQFQQVIDQAARFRNAVIVVIGHSDPTKTLGDAVRAGMSKGILTRVDGAGGPRFFLNQQPLDLTKTQQIVQLIEKGAFSGAQPDPRATMTAALNLSKERAESVKASIVGFAKEKQYLLDAAQIAPTGLGIARPVIAKPKNLEEAMENMRVEFKLMRVSAEVARPSDFDF
jgi:ABC-type nitrate/sulfonate/bicarbonate transport system substrate-binding protein/outer membrane protein OmpA-like peptidoglycan-associated protein